VSTIEKIFKNHKASDSLQKIMSVKYETAMHL